MSDIKIGLEIHAELDTKSKLFCSCPTQGSVQPNTRTCEICLGMPGSKPSVNNKAIEYAIKLAMALNCQIAKKVIFSRKSYFYPDMAKNYQITQYETPLGSKGRVGNISIKRVHLEEDPAAIVTPQGNAYVLVDYNRSGNPLCEIVTDPVILSTKDAKTFLNRLLNILRYLKIYNPLYNLIKTDANISIKDTGYVRTEIKNISGVREIERALDYEIIRHKQAVREGLKIMSETRSWNADTGITALMRSKETAEDYGYIYEPDLVPIEVTPALLKRLKSEIPELPDQKVKTYVTKYRLSKQDAEIIANEYALSIIFEAAIGKVSPILAARWIRRELVRVANYNKIDFSELQINTEEFIKLIKLVEDNRISETVAQKVLEKLIIEDINVENHIGTYNLELITDKGYIEKLCKIVVEENPNAVHDFKKGNANSLNYLVGQVVRKSQGKAKAKEIKERLRKLILKG